MKYAPPRIDTYSHALRAMNSSVPLSPPLITAALMRMLTTSAIIAQNSVVLNDAFVSWFRSPTAGRAALLRELSTRLLPVAPVVAMGDFSLDRMVVEAPPWRSQVAPGVAHFESEASRRGAPSPAPAGSVSPVRVALNRWVRTWQRLEEPARRRSPLPWEPSDRLRPGRPSARTRAWRNAPVRVGRTGGSRAG